MLIAKGCPAMRVYRLKGGQRGYGGHVLKSQGQTMDKAVVDVGKSESKAGSTFVCLSHAKRLVNLSIEPMTFEKLSKLGDKPTFQFRI